MPGPARVSFNEARLKPVPEQYKKSNIPVAYLLEGSFKSLFTNRLAPVTEKKFAFKPVGKPSKIIICSDGDLGRNDINKNSKQTYPLGYDRFAGIQFGNKEFLMNSMSYLLDDDGVILARAKEIQVRPLDTQRISETKESWQALNMIFPILAIGAFGIIRFYLRRKKYAQNNSSR
jgi:gliding-associated putative ABC transporter substrate-binding component GldG